MAGGAGPLNKGCERRTWACRTFQGGGERHDRFGVVVGEGSSSDGSRVVSLGESVPECTHSCQSPRWRTMRISREHFGAPQLQDPTAKLDELEAVETNELEHLDVAEQDALDRSSQEIADRYAKRILAETDPVKRRAIERESKAVAAERRKGIGSDFGRRQRSSAGGTVYPRSGRRLVYSCARRDSGYPLTADHQVHWLPSRPSGHSRRVPIAVADFMMGETLLGSHEREGGPDFAGGLSLPYRAIGLLKKKLAEILAILELRTLDVSGDFSFGRPQKDTDRGQLWSFQSGAWRSLQ